MMTNSGLRLRVGFTLILTKTIKEGKPQHFGHLVRQRDHQRALMEAKVAGRRGLSYSEAVVMANLKER